MRIRASATAMTTPPLPGRDPIALTRAMSLFDLGRGRGGVDQALRSIRQPLTVVGVDSDRLFPLEQQQRIARLSPGAGPLRVVHSLPGHDGFLVETDQLAAIVADALEGLRP